VDKKIGQDYKVKKVLKSDARLIRILSITHN